MALLSLLQDGREQPPERLHANGVLGGKARRDRSAGGTIAELTVCRRERATPFCPSTSAVGAGNEHSCSAESAAGRPGASITEVTHNGTFRWESKELQQWGWHHCAANSVQKRSSNIFLSWIFGYVSRGRTLLLCSLCYRTARRRHQRYYTQMDF